MYINLSVTAFNIIPASIWWSILAWSGIDYFIM